MDELDETDLEILRLLQADGRMSHAELAQRVGLAAPTVQRRVRLLEERGYIRGYAALIDPIAVGLPVTAFIFVETHAGCDLHSLERFVAALPAVQEAHRLLGEWCLLLKVRTASPQMLEQLLYHDLRNHPAVRRTQTTMATSPVVEAPHLPILAAQAQDAGGRRQG